MVEWKSDQYKVNEFLLNLEFNIVHEIFKKNLSIFSKLRIGTIIFLIVMSMIT